MLADARLPVPAAGRFLGWTCCDARDPADDEFGEVMHWTYKDLGDAYELVRKCVSQELLPRASAPSDKEDLVKSGLIDSMGWVGILSAIEEATGIRNFGNTWPKYRP